MASIEQLVKQIRFQLHEMRNRNEHHRFEDLCRHFARLRISERILPATGPVAAGGDQGKDFESYRTYLQSTPLAESTFLGKTESGDKLVFACTLQQPPLDKKIKGDLQTIFGDGAPADSVFYFCEANIPTAQRHKLQEYAKEEYQTNLEIIDGTGLAEGLSDIDVFWIAQEYLGIPANYYPEPRNPDTTYQDYKARWSREGAVPFNFADFYQIKFGLRRATFDKEYRRDLPFWISVIERLDKENTPDDLRLKAIYEICVAALRGLNNLNAKESLVRRYFEDFDRFQSTSAMEDAVVLLSYCSTASRLGHFDIDPDFLITTTTKIVELLDEQIAESTGPGRKASLLWLRGFAETLAYRNGKATVPDIERAFDFWQPMIEEAEKAPLFQIESFVDQLCQLAPVANTSARYHALTEAATSLLTDREAGRTAAEKCRDLALAYMEAGNYTQAIRQLHNSRIKWFTGETLRGSVFSILILAYCYNKLDLHYAAKYYALGATFMIHSYDQDEGLKDILPKAFCALCDTLYSSGQWLAFLNMIELALIAHLKYDQNPLDFEEHEDFQVLMFHSTIARGVTARVNAELSNVVEEIAAAWPLDSEIRGILDELSKKADAWWATAPDAELEQSLKEQLPAPPFSDCGTSRLIQWKALGVTWAVTFDNSYDATRIGEAFISALQIIQADLADAELCIVPTNSRIHVLPENDGSIKVDSKGDNDGALWEIRIPVNGDRGEKEDLLSKTMAVAITLIGKITLLSHTDFEPIITKRFKEALSTKVFNVRAYESLFMEFWPRDEFGKIDRRVFSPLVTFSDSDLKEHVAIGWNNNIGPGYSGTKATQILTNRYRQAIRPIRITLPKLLAYAPLRDRLLIEKQNGALDWQLLAVLVNSVVNLRVQAVTGGHMGPEVQPVFYDFMFREEREDDPQVDPQEILDQFEVQWNLLHMTATRTWGLTINMDTPDFKAIKRFLDVKYRHSTDDIEHEDFFSF